MSLSVRTKPRTQPTVFMPEEEMAYRIRRRHTVPVKVFKQHSENGETVTLQELRRVMTTLGCALSSQELKQLASKYNSHEHGGMDFKRFLKANHLPVGNDDERWSWVQGTSSDSGSAAASTRLMSFDSDGVVVGAADTPNPVYAEIPGTSARSPNPPGRFPPFQQDTLYDAPTIVPPLTSVRQHFKPGILERDGGLVAHLARDGLDEKEMHTKLPQHLQGNMMRNMSPTKKDRDDAFPIAYSPHLHSSIELHQARVRRPSSSIGALELLAAPGSPHEAPLRTVPTFEKKQLLFKSSKANVLSEFLHARPSQPDSPDSTGTLGTTSSRFTTSKFNKADDVGSVEEKGTSMKELLRAALAPTAAAASAQLKAFLTRADASNSGAIREIDLKRRLRILVPSASEDDINHAISVAGVSSTSGPKLPGHADIPDVNIASFVSWVVGNSQSHDTDVDMELHSRTTGAALKSKPRGNPVTESSRLTWNKVSDRFEHFRRAWESKHGAAARKELTSDLARQPEGPTWTSAEPKPFKVLHLAQPPPINAE